MGDILKILDTLRSLVADSDLILRSQREYDTADNRGEKTSRAETAFMAGHPYSRAGWAASLIPAGSLGQAFCGACGHRPLVVQDPHGLPSDRLGVGQVLLRPEEVLCYGGN